MGFIKGLIKLNIGALIFIAGYSFCKYVHSDPRYAVTRIDNVAYLLDKKTEEMKSINEAYFEVGTLRSTLEELINMERHAKEAIDLRHALENTK